MGKGNQEVPLPRLFLTLCLSLLPAVSLLGLAHAQLPLRLVGKLDIAQGADPLPRLAVAVDHRRRAHRDPAIAAVGRA